MDPVLAEQLGRSHPLARHLNDFLTDLANAGVSIEAVRRRLGHASTETTQLYALLDDKVADAEIRAARRRRDRATS
ncbi:Phage integrase family protein [Sinosporangium album]|uniref:Phage integrase family protein n=1 Tax=Sinosporangium album TaxID=504805 RepID=A0A1G8G986_9ACTN|nr:site-specific integrase [Sinosporangium album]SDH90860.1 Phage integrase family protein [Sinosporangium album]